MCSSNNLPFSVARSGPRPRASRAASGLVGAFASVYVTESLQAYYGTYAVLGCYCGVALLGLKALTWLLIPDTSSLTSAQR